jgi:3-oxoadipate enol-lactonase
MGEHLRAGDLDIWTEQVGQGPDVLLIGGAGDTVEPGSSSSTAWLIATA